LKRRLFEGFDFELSQQDYESMADVITAKYAHHEFNEVVEFMSGQNRDLIPKDQWDKQGNAKCMAVLFQGENAVKKIRQKLGNSDPKKKHIWVLLETIMQLI